MSSFRGEEERGENNKGEEEEELTAASPNSLP